MPRHAFTLIEMMVVVAIMAVLASLLIPTIGVVRRLVNDVKCGNQLQQIGAAIEVYKLNNDEQFPARLRWDERDPLAGNPITSDLFHSGGPLVGLTKILVCPRDARDGKDTNMGRLAPGGSGWDDLSTIYTFGSSYCYEVSGVVLSPGLRNFFFEDLPSNERPTTATWSSGKHHQVQFGNLTNGVGSAKGAPFPTSLFPIIRCYWHTQWTGNKDKDASRKRGVRNVSWDLNVFDTSPYWEHDVNPDIPY